MAGAIRALVVEDEELLRLQLVKHLQHDGFIVEVAATLHTASQRLRAGGWDVVLLDRRLPDGDGLSLCRAARLRGDRTPVVVYSVRSEDDDVDAGYAAGATLYLEKSTMTLRKLTSHLTAAARGTSSDRVQWGAVAFDREDGRLHHPDGTLVELSKHERRLCEELARHEGTTLSRDHLIERVWRGEDPNWNDLDVLVCRVRKKLGAASWMLSTARGVGYRFEFTRGERVDLKHERE